MLHRNWTIIKLICWYIVTKAGVLHRRVSSQNARVELGSEMNKVQLIRDLNRVGATRPKTRTPLFVLALNWAYNKLCDLL